MGEFGMRVEENINYGERTKGSQEYLSPRRKPEPSSLHFLALHFLRSDSGVRRNDELGINQHLPRFVSAISASLRALR